MSGTKKGKPAETKLVGRPKVDIELEQVTQMGMIGCTQEEIAAVLGVTDRTVRRWKEKADFLASLQVGQARGRATLRRLQWKQAEDGNPTMLIWLGKQLLGQRDKVEHALAKEPGQGEGMTVMQALSLYQEIRVTHRKKKP
jgi:predicted transcriptional regulator